MLMLSAFGLAGLSVENLWLQPLNCFFIFFFFVCGAWDGIQGLMCARNVFYTVTYSQSQALLFLPYIRCHCVSQAGLKLLILLP
jgi:hypothetical protein